MARERFLEAQEIDPRFPAALEWYKKAVAADPDLGDAYHGEGATVILPPRDRSP